MRSWTIAWRKTCAPALTRPISASRPIWTSLSVTVPSEALPGEPCTCAAAVVTPGVAALDQEGADAARVEPHVLGGEDDEDVGLGGVGDPRLLAVEHVAVPGLAVAGLHRHHVGAGLGLGRGEGADHRARGELRQERLAHPVGGEFRHGACDREGMGAERQEHAAVRTALAEPDERVHGRVGVAHRAGEDSGERLEARGLAEEQVVGTAEGCREVRAELPSLIVDRQLVEDRVRIRLGHRRQGLWPGLRSSPAPHRGSRRSSPRRARRSRARRASLPRSRRGRTGRAR